MAKAKKTKHLICRECKNGYCEVHFNRAVSVPTKTRPLTNCYKAKWKAGPIEGA